MTSEAQRKANARNAKLSKGPKTLQGKKRSSRNATRHGLTAPPPTELVEHFLGLVQREVPEARQEDGSIFLAQAVTALAEAEARLHWLRYVEMAFLDRHQTGAEVEGYLRESKVTYSEIRRTIAGVSPEVERMILARIGKLPLEVKHDETISMKSVSQFLQRLGRYRAEAESRRKTALRNFTEHMCNLGG